MSLSEFTLNTTQKLINRGWTEQNAILMGLMWLLFLVGLATTLVVTAGSWILGMDTYINFKICAMLTSFFGFTLVMGAVINYFETKKI